MVKYVYWNVGFTSQRVHTCFKIHIPLFRFIPWFVFHLYPFYLMDTGLFSWQLLHVEVSCNLCLMVGGVDHLDVDKMKRLLVFGYESLNIAITTWNGITLDSQFIVAIAASFEKPFCIGQSSIVGNGQYCSIIFCCLDVSVHIRGPFHKTFCQ